MLFFSSAEFHMCIFFMKTPSNITIELSSVKYIQISNILWPLFYLWSLNTQHFIINQSINQWKFIERPFKLPTQRCSRHPR